MKTLSDYQGEEAIELWGDLLELVSPILSDKQIADVVRKGGNKIQIAQAILVEHKSEAVKVLLRIDPTPINGLNLVTRLMELITEIGQDETVKSFFGFAEQGQTE